MFQVDFRSPLGSGKVEFIIDDNATYILSAAQARKLSYLFGMGADRSENLVIYQDDQKYIVEVKD